jgi:hypothetical protein
MTNAIRLLKWILKACHLFHAVCLCAEQPARSQRAFLFFGNQWRSPMVLIVLAAFAVGLVVGVLGMAPRWWRRSAHAGRRNMQRHAHRRRWSTRLVAGIRAHRMEFDISWLLLSLPLAFILGWAGFTLRPAPVAASRTAAHPRPISAA